MAAQTTRHNSYKDKPIIESDTHSHHIGQERNGYDRRGDANVWQSRHATI